MSDPILDYWLEKNANILYRDVGKDLSWAAGRAMRPLGGVAKATAQAGAEAARQSAALASLLSRRARHYKEKLPQFGRGRFYREVGHKYAPFVPVAAGGTLAYSGLNAMGPQQSWRNAPFASMLGPGRRGYFSPQELNVFQRHGVQP